MFSLCSVYRTFEAFLGNLLKFEHVLKDHSATPAGDPFVNNDLLCVCARTSYDSTIV